MCYIADCLSLSCHTVFIFACLGAYFFCLSVSFIVCHLLRSYGQFVLVTQCLLPRTQIMISRKNGKMNFHPSDHGPYIRWLLRNRCARKEQAWLFDLFLGVREQSKIGSFFSPKRPSCVRNMLWVTIQYKYHPSTWRKLEGKRNSVG